MRASGGGEHGIARAAAESATDARLAHQPALDGLRGVAVAAVLVFHGGHLAGGFLGVDAFFVLSGFLITSLLLTEARNTGRIALGAFWARRARRLLPALACVLIGVALYAALIAKPDELSTIRADALATIGYFSNWRAILNSHDYWAIFRNPSPLDHTWSLAIEEQFYVVWPLLFAFVIRAARGRSAQRVLALSTVLACTSLLWTIAIFDPANPSRVYYGTDTRIASILVGAALAAWLAARGSARTRTTRATLEGGALLAAGVLALAWARLTGSSDVLYRGGLFVCALATATVIAAAIHPDRGPVNRILSLRPLCALGLVSYGVYLWHWPIYVVLDESRTHMSGWGLLALRVAVTLVVAAGSYFWIEQPIRRGTGSFSSPARVAFTLSAAALIVVALVVTTRGAPTPRVVRRGSHPPLGRGTSSAAGAPEARGDQASTRARGRKLDGPVRRRRGIQTLAHRAAARRPQSRFDRLSHAAGGDSHPALERKDL